MSNPRAARVQGYLFVYGTAAALVALGYAIRAVTS